MAGEPHSKVCWKFPAGMCTYRQRCAHTGGAGSLGEADESLRSNRKGRGVDKVRPSKRRRKMKDAYRRAGTLKEEIEVLAFLLRKHRMTTSRGGGGEKNVPTQHNQHIHTPTCTRTQVWMKLADASMGRHPSRRSPSACTGLPQEKPRVCWQYLRLCL